MPCNSNEGERHPAQERPSTATMMLVP